MSREDWARSWKPWLRGAVIGFPIGALPAGGAEIPTFLSYALERRLSKRREEFGRGAIEGVAGPEAANNAAAAGVLVPLLTLGLPTSATAAIMLAAFQQFNLQPGPLIFTTNPELVWGLIASLYIGNVMLLLLNLPLAPLWARLLRIPPPLLYGGILVFATIGTYSLNNSVFDVGLMYVIGLIGFVMRRVDIPMAPAIIGMILGPMAEQQFRRALAISQGDPSVFLTRPISAFLLSLAVLAVVAVPLARAYQASRVRAGV
jgi:putative tricarboxylic transport membrane protein